MAFTTPTHINAFLRDLEDAKLAQSVANGRVEAAKQAIVDNFGKDALPPEPKPEAEKKAKAKPKSTK